MHTIGVKPLAIAAAVLRLTAASVSPNRRRRSEWPMITYSAPASLIMPGETSPVNAPSRSQYTILRGDADVRVARGLGGRVHGRERRRDDDLDVGDVLDERTQLLHEDDGLVHGLEHLPVAGDERDSHNVTSSWVIG